MTDTRRIAVKPLEWTENSDREYWYTAYALGVKYDVKEIGLGAWCLSINEDRIKKPFAYCEYAQSAAQADYERRILSALTPAPEAGWRDMDSAPKDGTEVLAFVGPGYKGGSLILSFFKENGFAAWRDWDHDIWQPTHWIPLPPAPGTQPATEQPSVKEAARCAKYLLEFCEHDEVTELVLRAIAAREGDKEKDDAAYKAALRSLAEDE